MLRSIHYSACDLYEHVYFMILGNFVTDIMLTATDADIALLNSGTLRSDRIHRRGNFKLKDLLAILPLVDPVIVLQITGQKQNPAL